MEAVKELKTINNIASSYDVHLTQVKSWKNKMQEMSRKGGDTFMIQAQIEVRFNNLLAQLELETGVRPTQKDIAEAIDVAESTLSRFAQGKTGRYDADILVKLVDYFDGRLENDCTLADLIAYPPFQAKKLASLRSWDKKDRDKVAASI